MSLAERIILKSKRGCKYLKRNIGWYSGLDASFYKKAKGARILVYHGLCKKDHTRFNTIFLKIKTFEEHLKFYKKYFNVISLDDYYAEKFDKDKFNVCISFDDGFANNYNYVLPLINKYKVPATFFITGIRESGYDILWNDFLAIITKYGSSKLKYKDDQYIKNRTGIYVSIKTGKTLSSILRKGGFDNKKEMMNILYPLVPFREMQIEPDYWVQTTTEQIKELSNSGLVTIGSHGYYHNDLAEIPITEASYEMRQSKQYLEKIIGRDVKAIAFPYGTYTKAVKQQARIEGYSQLLATDFLFKEDHDDQDMRERFTVNPFINTINQMHAIITKKYERYYY